MAHQTDVYLLGDQTYDVNAKLNQFLLIKHNPVLTAFLEQSYQILRAEIGKLHLLERQSFPRFANIAELIAKSRQGQLPAALQTPLICIYQLAFFISHHSDSRRAYPLPLNTYLLSLCARGIPAAAISCSKSASELLPAAVHAVGASFRLALCAAEFSERVQSPPSNSPWSIVVIDLSAEKATIALDDFSQLNSLHATSRPYISAYSPASVTISGPPGVLENLKQHSSFVGKKIVSLPVHVASHAPHLFTSEDVDYILETTSSKTWTSYLAQIPVVSCATGKLIWSGNFKSLLQTAVEQCLMQPLRWDKINEEFSMILLSSGASHVNIIPIATKSEVTLLAALKDLIKKNQSSTNWPNQSPIIEIENLEKTLADAPETFLRAKSKIAVCGLASRFPDAQSPEAFWDLLHRGLDVVKEVPAAHWDVKTHVDPTGKAKNTSAVPWGCWIDNPGLFDARFFAISPKEAPNIDPAQRIALMATYEAMEAAGIVPDSTPSTQKDRIGVFLGVSSNDWGETNSSQQIGTHSIVGGIRPFITGRVNYCHKFSGPSYAVDTACSSSLAAMQIACNALWEGDCDTAVAGGTNVITNPDGHAALDRGFFLSRTGNCKTFDDAADGYCRGEGVGIVLLKRLEDALADGDPIQAVIVDIKTNHSAESDSITRPHAPTQIVLFDKLLSGSGTSPDEISYIEMHGTGTQHGDAAEMTSVLATFAPTTKTRARNQPLFLGAAKANIGHGEAVSGITSIAKVILMMQHNEIPPHCGIKPGSKINHTFPLDLKDRNVHIAFQPTPWNRGSKARKVLINNFSAPGGNTAMVLEDAPLILVEKAPDERSSHIVAISVKCAESLMGNMVSLLKFIQDRDDVSIRDLSYTTTARRQHHIHRACITGSTLDEIKAGLQNAIELKQGSKRPISAPKVIFAFTGQGSQYLGMGKQLLAISQFYSNTRRLDQLARTHGFPAFKHVFEDSGDDIESYPPVVLQLAVTCLEMALARLLMTWGVVPEAVVGHSLGEYAALNVAGVLSDSETIYLVGTRAELLQKYCMRGSHAMLAVRSSVGGLQNLLQGKKFEIACVNGPEDTVLGGPNEQINSLKVALGSLGVKTQPSKSAAQGITYNKPSIPVLSPLLGRTITGEDVFGPEYLVRHCREPVNMKNALDSAYKTESILSEKSIIIEVGPQPVVSGMVKATIGSHLSILHTLQRYSWELKDYWIQYVEDWSLRKGDPLPQLGPLEALVLPVVVKAVPANTKLLPQLKIDSTTVHKILEETSNDHSTFILIESDLSRPDLLPIVQGHFGNGIPLCTPSVYADIALTVGSYIRDKYQPTMKERIVDVADMEVERALIAKGKGPQMLRASAKVDWASKKADFSFFSVDATGKTILEHATCKVKFQNNSQLESLLPKRSEHLALMDKLARDVQEGKAFRVKTDVSFKLVAALATFHKEYRSTGEITLNGDTLEATSAANLSTVKKGGKFHCHPAYIDGFTQIAGFTLNAKGSTDLEVEVYVNRGWDSLQIFKEVSPTATYKLYVQMSISEGTIYKGDVIVLDDEGITVFFKGVSLRGIPRKAFNMVLQAADEGRELGAPSTAPKHGNKTPSRSLEASSRPAKAQSFATIAQSAPTPSFSAPQLLPKVAAPAKPPAKKSRSNAKFNAALQIILEETGLSGDKLDNESSFMDMGVDSLLSMVINSRFREELELDMDDEDNSIFITYPTIGPFKRLLDDSHDEPADQDIQDDVPPCQPAEVVVPAVEKAESIVFPVVETKRLIGMLVAEPAIPLLSFPVTRSKSEAPSPIAFESILEIIAEETGVEVVDLKDECALADVGIDSLLSMVIASRLREELSMELESENGFFVSYPTIQHIKDFCNATYPDQAARPESPKTEALYAKAGSTNANQRQLDVISLSDESPDESESEPGECRPATSVILQGFPKTAEKILFLLPGGGGSSSSYVPIPRLQSDVCIIGLNCPYGRDPENMNCSINDLMHSYVTEIRRRQPKGPYHIGGWSSGGVMAYITVQRLLKAGEEVRTLIIFDSPMPAIMDKLPPHFYDYCKAIGLFGKVEPPAYLLGHFDATVDVLEGYRCKPLPHTPRPIRLAIIWAAESVEDGANKLSFPNLPHNSNGLSFMVARRTDFGPAGWETLIPNADVMMGKINANHFSMMQKPYITQIARFIEKAMA